MLLDVRRTSKLIFSYLSFSSVQVTGPSGQMTWIRGGPMCLDAKNILQAIDHRFNLFIKYSFLVLLHGSRNIRINCSEFYHNWHC